MSPWRVCINQCLTFPWETGQSKHWVNITWVFILSNHSFQKKITYQEVLKQRFFISNVENCVSTVNYIKWFWCIIYCCYVSNHKFNLKIQRTTWKFSAWATKFRNTFILLILHVPLLGCVLVYRYTKERNSYKLRHNSMYGYENNRNSPVYQYTRTAPTFEPFSSETFSVHITVVSIWHMLSLEISNAAKLQWHLHDKKNSQTLCFHNINCTISKLNEDIYMSYGNFYMHVVKPVREFLLDVLLQQLTFI